MWWWRRCCDDSADEWWWSLYLGDPLSSFFGSTRFLGPIPSFSLRAGDRMDVKELNIIIFTPNCCFKLYWTSETFICGSVSKRPLTVVTWRVANGHVCNNISQHHFQEPMHGVSISNTEPHNWVLRNQGARWSKIAIQIPFCSNTTNQQRSKAAENYRALVVFMRFIHLFFYPSSANLLRVFWPKYK